MMRPVVLGVMLLVLCSPLAVRAELTTAERADIKNLVDSSKALRTGERYLTAAMAVSTTSTARPALANALDRFNSAQIDHWRALAFFLHAGTENPTPKPTLSSTQWYTSAWFHLDAYVAELAALEADLDIAQAFNATNASYQDNIRRARDIWVTSARTYAERMNPALPYLSPWPALLPGKTVQNVVGPHGDYRSMQWLINRGKNYAMDTYGTLITAYRNGANGAKIRDAWTHSSDMLDTLDRSSALLANVTFTTEEAAEDRFCRVLRVTKLLTVNAGQRYQTWGDAVSNLVPAPYNLVVAKLVDSWKHAIDLSSWKALVFPESTRCASPFLKD
jgi:hypothetical protein